MRIATTTWTAISVAIAIGVGLVGVFAFSGSEQPAPTEPPKAEPPRATPVVDVGLDLLCGKKPASLGTAFRGLEIGDDARAVEVPSKYGIDISLWTTGRRFDGATIKIPNDPGWASCYEFAKQLSRRWGAPHETDGGDVWRDGDRVARFSSSFACKLQFYREVSPEQWLNDTRSSRIPIWAIGRPVGELQSVLGVRGNNPKELRWRDETLGDSAHLDLVAHLQREQVVGIEVVLPFDDPVTEVLWARLKRLFGAPIVSYAHEDQMKVTWRRPRITANKYWGQAGLPMRSLVETGEPLPPPRRPDANEGVLTRFTFGK